MTHEQSDERSRLLLNGTDIERDDENNRDRGDARLLQTSIEINETDQVYVPPGLSGALVNQSKES